MDWMNILQDVGLLLGGGGIAGVISHISKSGRKRDRADADARIAEAQRQMIDNYEERIKDLHAVIDKYNGDEKKHAVRLSEKEQIIDDKTERIRELSGKVWTAEQEVNRVNAALNEANARITALTEERDEERRRKEYYRMWHCRRDDCTNGIPPRDRLKGQKFKEPK